MKVLVAEDNIDSRALLKEILQTLGCEVIVAVDGVHAWEKLETEIPDLCILDVDMPRKDGFQLVAEIKADPRTANIPVIMLTAQSDVESRVKGLGLGAEDYLTKPYNPRELIARVNARLRAKAEKDTLRQQQELIQNTFSRFVAREIIDIMLADPSTVKLGGQLRPVTVLFADLEGFTSVAEREDPVELIHVLNQYQGLLVSVVKRNGGTIDKFLGDGLMALFNAPINQDDHVFKAVKSALEIRQSLAIFHSGLEQRFRLGINFGIHTGMAVVGNIGGADLMNYTAVGDTVNLAARLQGMSENNQVTVSASVYAEIKDRVDVIAKGSVMVKGRAEPVTTYLVTGLKSHD